MVWAFPLVRHGNANISLEVQKVKHLWSSNRNDRNRPRCEISHFYGYVPQRDRYAIRLDWRRRIMSSKSPKPKSWLAKRIWNFIIGVPLMCFVFGPLPFPLSLGFYYPIRDHLRGHPDGRHGTLPDRFVGLWVRDTTIEFDTLGQAFYLMPGGRFAGMPGMTVRRWHFDRNTFFVDSVSRCGNCYQGNVTSEASASFSDPDHMILVSRDKGQTKGLVGHYRRIQITKELKDLMAKQSESEDDEISFRARMVKKVIEHHEALSLRS